MKTKIKIFIMTMVAFIATTLSTSGFPEGQNGWMIFGITILGTILTYVGKNILIPSTSTSFSLNWMDLMGGAIVAIGSAVSNYIAQIAIDDEIDWKSFGKLITMVILGYLSKTLVQQPKPESNENP